MLFLTMLVSLSTLIRCVLIISIGIRASRLDWKGRDLDDGYQFLILRCFHYSSVSSFPSWSRTNWTKVGSWWIERVVGQSFWQEQRLWPSSSLLLDTGYTSIKLIPPMPVRQLSSLLKGVRSWPPVVICVIIYNAAFGMSWGPVPWLYPPEIMPLPFRAKGVSLSTATNWLFVRSPILARFEITWA